MEMIDEYDTKFSIKRPHWNSYFIGIAFIVAQRSHDIHTKHGTVIIDKNRHIVSTGYNGFPPGLKDDELPTSRPEKYPWMNHSEENAIFHKTTNLEGCAAYVTGLACSRCLKILYTNGITEVYQYAKRAYQMDDQEKQLREDIINKTKHKMKVYEVIPDLSWLQHIKELQ